MHIGTQYNFPFIRTYNKKLAYYVTLSRPYTLLSALLVGIIGVMIERTYHDQPYNYTVILLVGLSLMFMHAGAQITNQSANVLIDRFNKPYRPIPQQKVGEDEAEALAIILYFFAFILAFLASITYFVLSIIILFFSIEYSRLPLRAKRRRTYIPLVYLGFLRGVLLSVATWSVYSFNTVFTTPLPWVYGILASLWVFAHQASKDFGDTLGDQEAHIRTLPIVFGKTGALKRMFVLSLLLPVGLTLALVFQLLPVSFMSLYVMIPLSFLLLVSIAKGIKMLFLENNLGWVIFYFGIWFIPFLSLLAIL